MTDQTGDGQPQKTVAELLAQHGAQVDGGSRRRRRRAAEDDDEPATPETPPGATGSHRRPGVTDTGPQAIIDRVAGEGTPPPPNRPAGRRRAEPPPPPPPAPRAVPQDSQPLPRPVPPPPARPAPGSAESSQYQRPPAPPQQSGQYARPPQESGQFASPPPRPPQDSGQYASPQESAQLPVPPRAPRRQPPPPQPSQQLPTPPPPAAEETRGAVPPVRRRPPPPSQQLPTPPPQPSQQLPTPPPGGPLSARLDGLNGTPDADVDGPPGPMASGTFSTPSAAPGRPRRGPARRPQPQQEAYTEQFDAVAGEPLLPPAPGKKKPDSPPPSSPGGLANWRKRRQKEQLEDTEIGVMPVVPTDAPADGYPEDDFEPEGFAPEGSGYQAAYDAGPPTGTYPPPMPFAPGDRASRAPIPDDLEPYEREFADGYPADGPDFEQDDYGYEQGEGYEDDEYDDAPEPVAEPEPATSPGKAWLALAGQLAMGVVGGAAVWLGFNWLWVNIPAAALVAALLVVVALVWIVRKIRRAEDLQTTVLAVLVGLVVTVSPAALLLVGR
ncbi:hypothetical protein Amsp01_070730 [Amycolatopsis sp. NBRC 101858]|uniref:hypothetical protein n=1 Tax=Amycolatopsis sp. NBRC 101858 TaxID=3032200 RepID=UPI0024A1916F|nr:hypothetical protein [Amycolatopsis sp. NBRC 101858]GLY41050.1 hypothetical protein Amsp01_070730 [Amycolatopsis sp. NBRC 101858]